MAASNKEFTHYNCNHNFGGTVAARGLLTKGPMPTDAGDVTSLPPKVGEMRADATMIVMWDGTVWGKVEFSAFAA